MNPDMKPVRDALQTAERLADDKGSDLQYEIIAKGVLALDAIENAPTESVVSLEKCARAAFTWRDQGRPESEWLTWGRLSENRKKPWLIKAKAVLDAAEVPYGD